MVQRYKFESKSQPMKEYVISLLGCFQWFKDTNLKVNHNYIKSALNYLELFPMVQRYKFESKSQHCQLVSGFFSVVSNGSKIQI